MIIRSLLFRRYLTFLLVLRVRGGLVDIVSLLKILVFLPGYDNFKMHFQFFFFPLFPGSLLVRDCPFFHLFCYLHLYDPEVFHAGLFKLPEEFTEAVSSASLNPVGWLATLPTGQSQYATR